MKDLIKNIICPTDLSDNAYHAIKYTHGLAKIFNSEVILFHCSKESADIDYAKNELNAIIKTIRKEDQFSKVNFLIVIRQGVPEKELLEYMSKNKMDLVSMAINGYAREYSSITSRIIENTSCPVLEVPGNHVHKPIYNIVFATDMDTAESEAVSFSLRFAEHLQAHIDFLNVESQENKKLEEVAEYALTKLVNKSKYEDVAFHLVDKEDTIKGILDFAENSKADLIILSHKKLYEESIAGTHTHRLVSKTPIPVMILNKTSF
ncbi:MAG TPA: universal stress protein [Cytophagaceae bacterium]|jgi:nucleotide-binding universal stress UspA family protein|nr:universal stress protein [Cytophagaceae bacterium]